MSDNSQIKIMQSLGLDYSKAILSTMHFEKSIQSLNKQLANMKSIATQNTKDINTVFASQLGQVPGDKTIVNQYGNAFKVAKSEAEKMQSSLKDNLNLIKQSNLEKMKAQAALVQQRASSKELGNEYIQQSGTIREQLSLIQARLQSEGKLTAEEVRQTKELKEQLDILNAQSRTDVHDKSRLDSPTPNEFKDRASWFTDGAKFYAVSKAAKEANGTIKEVEMGMVDIQRVMSDSSFVFEDYRDELLKLGVDYGQTFENAQNIALRWAQSGYNVADSLELTETSLLALNAAELDAKSATESMIGIMAQWNLEAQDLELIMDKINKTADTHSATSQDLVDGLLRSSGAARTMNLSIEETIALLVNMREASGRTGREVGNALSSIISYMQRPAAIKAIEGAGISMFADEAKTQFRSVIDIFEDMSVQWNVVGDDLSKGFLESADSAEFFNEELAVSLGMQEEWNDLQKRDVSQAAAGVHRRNFLIGLMERMGNTQKALNGMMDAGGYSMEKNAQTMEALEKKQESLKTSVKALQVAMGDAGLEGALKGLADGGTTAINAINDLPKPMKDLTLSAMSTFTAVKSLEWGMKTFGIKLPGIYQMIGSLTSGTWSLTDAFKAGATGVGAFVKANAPLLALSAAVGVIMAVTNAIKKQREETEKSIEVFQRQKEISSSIDELTSKYEKLASKTELTTEEQTELFDIKQKITSLLPESSQALDNENMSLETQLEIVKDLNEAELERAKIKARKTLEKHESNYDQYQNEIEEATRILEEQTAKYEELYRRRNSLTKQEQMEMRNSRLLIEAQSERLEANKTYIEAVDAARELHNKSLENSNTLLDENTNITDDNTDSNNINADSKDSQTEATEKLIESFNDSTSALQSYYVMLDEVNSKEGLSAKSKQEIIEKFPQLLPYLGNEIELREQLIKIIAEEERVQAEAYHKMIMDSEEFFNTKIKGNSVLVDRLGEFYNKDLENSKSLADAKWKVESNLVQQLNRLWAKYYGAVADNMKSNNLNAIKHLEQNMDDPAAKAILDAQRNLAEMEQRFRNIAVDFGKVDFKGINTSGIKGPSTPKTSSGSKASPSKSNEKYENKELERAIKLLEHRKKLSEETQDTIRAEVEELKRINKEYVKTEEERMDMAEKIYAAEKRLRDRTLQDSVNWINEKKNFNKLSIEDEIAAWERVKKNQVDNINAVKQATLELYKLKNQVMSDSYSREENSIRHLTKLGILSPEEQIKKYRELYKVKAKDYKEEQARIEDLFDLHKKLISDQQRTIKEAHDSRIEQIEKEAKAKKDMHQAEIDAINKELELLNKQEDEYDHDKKMADLKEQLAYWEVRTSEDARKKVIDLKKQIDEAEHKREVELKKQSLEDKKKVLEDEVRSVEDTAKEEREKLEKSYQEIEIAFDEHSINLIALASTMSEGMFDEFKKNYLIPLENALRDADYNSIGSIVDGINNYGNSLSGYADGYSQDRYSDHDWGMTDSDYLRFVSNGDKWEELRKQGSSANKAEMDRLNAENNRLREKYGRNPNLGEYPKFHKGGWAYSEGLAVLQKDELVFPPDLSIGIAKLFPLLSNLAKSNVGTESSSLTDNRKETKIGTLLNVENMHMEDDIDGEILARELQRQLSSM